MCACRSLAVRDPPLRVSRVIAMTFLGPSPTKESMVNHIDGDTKNNAVDNLEWITPQGNTQHAVDTGLNDNRVAVVQMKDGVKIAEYSSIKAAAKVMVTQKLSVSQMSASTFITTSSRDGSTAYGFEWTRI